MVVVLDEDLKRELEEERQQKIFNLAMNKKNIATEDPEKKRARGEPVKDLN